MIYVVAFLGIILIGYGVFLETEKRQDLVFLIGAGSLLVYAIFIGNLIFTIAMAVFFLASLTEFLEILLGIHKHNDHCLKQIIREGRQILKK
ncbi:MAG TPA: hypothetical protein DEB09_04480 [Candidatus Magasanikbacteria bacterium]|nr:hypothetical protein [Candidatus Magasanikbacteria bacterium]